MADEGKCTKLETSIEAAVILAFFTAILFLGPAAASEHKIKHDYPVGYAASDSYQHQSRAEAIKNMGQYRNEAPYMMTGLTDIVGFYPPVLYHITVLLSTISGLETYDALFLIIGLALALGALVAYHLARNLGKAVAFLSLPLTLFITIGAPFLGIATFGQMPAGFSALFLAATAWAITKLELSKGYLIAGVFLAGTIMTHTSEALFFGILVAILFLLMTIPELARNRVQGIKNILKENKRFLAAIGVAMLLSLYFLPMFTGIWLKMQPYRFSVETVSASFPAATVYPADFGFMLLVLIAGIISALLFFAQKKGEGHSLIESPMRFTLIFSCFMLLAGFGTYAGFGLRAFQVRLFWPIFLAPLAGFGTYQLLRPLLARLGKNASPLLAVAIITALLSTGVVARYYAPPSTGSMSQFHWEAMNWISENTPKDARVYVLYSQVYSQTSVLYNTERISYFLELNNYNKIIQDLGQNGSFEREHYVTAAADSGAGLPYRKSLLSFGRHTGFLGGQFDICYANYYIVDKAFGENQQVLGQVNTLLLQKLLKANATLEYQNQWLAILKNKNVGGDCIA